MPAEAGGNLSLAVGGIASAQDLVTVGAILGRADVRVLNGNTVEYSICPAAGCPVSANFEAEEYELNEGEELELTVTLEKALTGDVVVPIRVADSSTASGEVYALSHDSLTFTAAETSQILRVTAVENEDDAELESVALILEFGELPASVRAGTSTTTTINILDNDDPIVEVSFGAAIYTANEGGAPADVVVTLSAPPEREVTILITTEDQNGATLGDYSGVPDSVTFGPEDIEQDFAVAAEEETDEDLGESVRLGFGELPERVGAGDQSNAVVYLRDNDSDEISLSVSQRTVSEDAGTVDITVTASLLLSSAESLSVDLRLPLTLSGSAMAGSDYSEPSPTPSIIIPANSSTGASADTVFTLDLTDDAVVEGSEIILLDSTVAGFDVRAVGIQITDSDTAAVSITGPDSQVSEGGAASFTVSLSHAVDADVTAEWSVVDGSASGADDIDAQSLSGSVSFPANSQAGAMQMVEVGIAADVLSEGEETFMVSLGTVTAGNLDADRVVADAAASSAEATIAPSGMLTVSLSGLSRGVEGTTLTYTLDVAGGISTADVIATLAVGSESTVDQDDYSGLPETVAISSGQSTATFMVDLVRDDVREGEERLVIELAAVEGGGGGGVSADPGASAVSTAVAEALLVRMGSAVADAAEGGTFDIAVTVNPMPEVADVTVSYVLESGSAGADDYTDATGGSIVIAAGQSSATIRVTAVDDELSESAESFTVTLTGVTSSDSDEEPTELIPEVAERFTQATIAASDPLTVSLSGLSRGVEGTTLTYTLDVAGGISTADVIATLAVGSESTVDQDDYSGLPETVAISSGQSTATFMVDLVRDDVREGEERLVIELAAVEGGGGGGVSADPGASAVSTAVAEALLVRMGSAVADAAEGGTFDIAVTVNPMPEVADVTVSYVLESGSAGADDYTDATGGSIVIAAGQSSATIRVTAVDDELSESAESFTVTLTGVTSSDSDEEPTELIPEVAERFTQATIAASDPLTVSLSGLSRGVEGTTLTYTLDVAGGISTADVIATLAVGSESTVDQDDYSGLPETVAISSGQSTATFMVDLVRDDVREGEERLVIELAAVEGGGGGGVSADPNAGSVTTALRETPMVRMGVAFMDVDEGATLEVPVNVEPAPEEANFTVSYTLVAGSASASDYSNESGGTITIAAGQNAGTIRVMAVNDNLSEPAESFSVVLAGVTSSNTAVEPAELSTEAGQNTTQATIAASDPLTVSIDGPAEVREGHTATYMLSIEGGESTADVTLTPAFAVASEAGAADLSGLPASVNIAAGQTSASFTVEAVRDGLREGEERLVLEVANLEGGGGGGVLADPSDGSVSTLITEVDPEARARAMQFALAGFGRTIGGNVVDMVAERADSHGAGTSRSFATLGGRPIDPASLGFGARIGEGESGPSGWVGSVANLFGVNMDNPDGLAWEALQASGITSGGFNFGLLPDARSLLTGSSFELGLGQKDEEAPATWTLWGRGDITAFEGRPEDDFSMDGEVIAGHLGLDLRVSDSVLAGVALSRSEADVDYRFSGISGDNGGIEMGLTSAHPYVHWSPCEGLGVWGSMGFGRGDATLTDDNGAVKTDISMRMAAGGIQQDLAPWGSLEIALKGDAYFVRMESDEQEDLPGVQADASRLRLALEGSSSKEFEGGSLLTGNLELGARMDDGDAETGAGAELGAGLAYSHPGGLEIQVRGHVLLTHEESEFEQWGASLAVSFDWGVPGEGLQFVVSPTWGAPSTGAEGIWASTRGAEAFLLGRVESGINLETRVGYGINLPNGRGLLTLFGEMGRPNGAPVSLRVGTELGRIKTDHSALSFELYGERFGAVSGEEPDYGIVLNARLGF